MNPDHIDAAGCIIETPHGYVMGINRLINRLQLPIGSHMDGESSRDTAARETLEETGLKVIVEDVAIKLDESRVIFYICVPIASDPDYANLKPIDRVEVSRAMVVNPFTLTTPDGESIETKWRFPAMRWLLKLWFGSKHPQS